MRQVSIPMSKVPTNGNIHGASPTHKLGLVVSEVLTNASRYAFLGRDAGTVAVEAWTDPSQMIVRIRDDGVGMEQKSGRTVLGSKIIRSLIAQLDATIELDSAPNAGTKATSRLPMQQK